MERMKQTDSRTQAGYGKGEQESHPTPSYDMRHQTPSLESRRSPRRAWQSILVTWAALAFALTFAPQAKADFINNYAFNLFTLTRINTDGSTPDGTAMTPDNGLTVVVTGGNNGSGWDGNTDLTIQAAAAGLVQFNYSYSACDIVGTCDIPTWDLAGYLLGTSFVPLADTDGMAGFASFAVTAGQIFGFRVRTLDNGGEPGVFTVSNFSAPSSQQSGVPEPGTFIPMIFAVAAAGAWRLKRHRRSTEENV